MNNKEQKYLKKLLKSGYVVINNAISINECEKIREIYYKIHKKYKNHTKVKNHLEELWNTNNAPWKNW